jgi:tRNA (cmo5U34)-methyltransferase
MKVDKNISSEVSGWKFNKEVANSFEEHVRKSIPLYDNIHKTIEDLSEWFIEDDTNVYDIGTSTGECLKRIMKHHKNKKVRYIGVDNSEDMIEKAKENSEYDIKFINEDIVNEKFKINNANFITVVLTLQFIPKRKRQNVINKIYEGLNKGGALIVVEKVVGNNARFDEMFIELYHDFKLENGLTEKEVFAKSRSLRGVMQPNTTSENIEMLNKAGFADIDIFYKWCNFVGFIAVK